MPLMKTSPASIRSANFLPASVSPVHRFEPRPKSVSLATRSASSASFTRITAATGPKVSSWYAGIPGRTFVSTVGSK